MSSSLIGDSFFGLDLKKIKSSLMGFRRSVSKRILLLDFDSASLTLAEAQILQDAVNFEHVRRLPLPEEALERGVPAEPRKMAALIRGVCEAADIPAHRAAVVIPHDAVFTTILQLPRSIEPSNALDYILDPASAAQVPVQLDQMDADLIPLDLPGIGTETRPFFLIAVPRKLVDRVVETLKYADLDLFRLQVGIAAQLQHLSPLVDGLNAGIGVLHLDLLRECTLASLLIAEGPVRLARLTSIRNFPDPPPRQEDSTQSNVSVESQIIASDSYLPLSELDIRRLCQEINQFLADCLELYPGLKAESVVISGVNSAHPALEQLFAEALKRPVKISRSLSTDGVGLFSSDDPIVLQSVGNLIGLGLGFLPQKAMQRAAFDEGAVSDDQPIELHSEIEIMEIDSIPPQAEVVNNDPLAGLILLPKPTTQLLLEAHQELETESLTPDSSASEEEVLSMEDMSLSIFTEEVDPSLRDELRIDLGLTNHADPGSTSQDQPDDFESDQSRPAEGFLQQEPIFSFSRDESQVLADVDSPTSEMLSSEIHLEEDEDEVPFSMNDLLNSYEAKEEISLEPTQPMQLQNDDLQVQDEEESAAYLHDDPSLWPSITKVDQPLDGEQAEN